MNKIVEIIKQLESTSSTNDKIKILKSNKDNELLQRVLEYTLNPYKKYKITEKTLIEGECKSNFDDIFKLLDTLSTSNINDLLREEVNAFLGDIENLEIRELYKRMILKDLKCNISAKTVNKVWKNLIPEFNVMLAESYFKQKSDYLKGKEFIISQKLDGNRLVGIKNNDKVEFYTRQGKLLEGLEDLEREFENIPNGIVLDGEILLRNYNNLPSDELFRETMKVARKKGIKKDLEFHVFDCVTLDGFMNGIDKTPCKERKLKIKKLIKDKEWLIEVPSLYIGKDEHMIVKLLNEAIARKKEGIMINIASAPYECKRTKGILKVKQMQSYDLKVVGFEEGSGNFKGLLGAVLVDLRGENIVGVGSGWSLEDRKEIWDNQSKYLGRVLEVQFFEETVDSKTGLPSLRFPVAKIWREEGKEVSYE